MPERVLIAGVSTRAAAESAARAGYRPIAIDAFVDLDQHRSVLALSPPGSYSPHAAALSSGRFECDAVVYLSGFENHPAAVARLAAGRTLWGNTPEVLVSTRDPEAVRRAFTAKGHPVPRVWRDLVGGSEPPSQGPGQVRWLQKPVAAGGGHGVRPWSGRTSVPGGEYLQEFVAGVPGAIAFAAAAGRIVPLGTSRQLIGDVAFGASGFQYAGSVLSLGGAEFEGGSEFDDAVRRLALTATRAFGLVGVNGIDFVARDGVPYPVEINPRWCASMELVELAFGLSVFRTHAEACAKGVLPAFDPVRRSGSASSGAVGKAFVFARENVEVGDTTSWRDDAKGSVRDVPRPGTHIRSGRPVCTVFASGRNADACYDALRERAGDIYARLEPWRQPPSLSVPAATRSRRRERPRLAGGG